MAKRKVEPEKPNYQEAIDLVYGDRAKQYGHPKINFKWIAAHWDLHVRMKLKTQYGIEVPGFIIQPEDFCDMMADMKKVRDFTSTPKPDNRRDRFGYLVAKERLREE